jgi:protein involved in polysaccharide export with SLBB domain
VASRRSSRSFRFPRRVSVVGEVREPGIYLADLTMTLPDIIARAGGVTEKDFHGAMTMKNIDQMMALW